MKSIKSMKKYLSNRNTIPIGIALLLLSLTQSCITPGMLQQSMYNQANLQNPLSPLIDRAVFEVIIPKPTEDTVTYEKELPMHLLPYSVRNDKYYSIGTAFAVGRNKFVSAAHVIQMIYKSQFEKYYLRDKNKNIYEIDKVYKYSTNRDFIVFSVKNGESINAAFKINSKPTLNTNIFAVGNAYGEGIIMRQGVLTSMTPEEENGEWKWLRFSAAASPGNSGGPLLDSFGNVIGIVVRKSENENLNYALPITELNNVKKDTAVDHERLMYGLLNMTRTKIYTYHHVAGLPVDYISLREDLTKSRDIFLQKAHNDFLKENKKNIFPRGKGSMNVLHYTNTESFPGLIAEDKNKEWKVYYPKTKTFDLDKGGYIQLGVMTSLVFVKTRNPGNISLKDSLKNPGVCMDQLLKALPIHRKIMGNEIRITSYGKPSETFLYTDRYKRKWIASLWYTKHDDTRIIAFTTPIPGGTFTMLSHASTSSDYMIDLKYIIDFIHISYLGTFQEWKEFFSLKEYIPDIFQTIKFKYRDKYKALYKSRRMYFVYSNSMQEISRDSIMVLNFAYFVEKRRIRWDINEIIIGEDKNNSNYFYISKLLKPSRGLDEVYYDEWQKVSAKKYPYNKTPYINENVKIIKSVCTPRSKQPRYLYKLGFVHENNINDSAIKSKLNTLDSVFKFR